MASNVESEDIPKLMQFIAFVSSNPTVLNSPKLHFVKEFVEKFGGKIPPGEFEMPTNRCPFTNIFSTDSKNTEPKVCPEPEEAEMESESESEVELDMEGVIEGDTGASQPMGDSSKTPTEEEVDQASELRSQAAAAYSEQKFQEAIDLYTQAIELNPGNALFHAKRGQAFLKLKQPNACIRDCDKALELNCDSAASYKFRGRAHRLLGNWELSANDLRQACKLDFDEEADEWLREVTPNAKKIEQHRIKQERKKAEKELKKREEIKRMAQEAKKKEREQQQQQSTTDREAPSFNMGDGVLGFNEMIGALRDPIVAAAIKDIGKNPANIEKYKSNPKIAKILQMLSNIPGGIPGDFPGFGFDDNKDGDTTPPPESAKDTNTAKKPDFVDDGLD